MLQRTYIAFFILYVVTGISRAHTASVSLSAQMNVVAANMVHRLGLGENQNLSVTTIDEDATYMLPLKPLYLALEKALDTRLEQVTFSSFRGRENNLIRNLLVSSGGLYEPFTIEEKSVDSLLLTGAYFFDERRPGYISVALKIIDRSGFVRFESSEFSLSYKNAGPDLLRTVFDPLMEGATRSEILFRGRLIAHFDRLFNTPNTNFLTYPAEYSFVLNDPYVIPWQVDALRELLTMKYGVMFTKNNENKVIVENGGSITWVRDHHSVTMGTVIDREPLLPRQVRGNTDTLYYLPQLPASGRTEKKLFSTAFEKNVRREISTFFSTTYPRLFSPFQFETLRNIFISLSNPTVLVGNKIRSDPVTGEEIVAYHWYYPLEWLSELKRAVEIRGRHFDVDATVLGVFNDNIAKERFWAIVLQNWCTTDKYGKEMYTDQGFLLVHFDVTPRGNIRHYHIYYRLWFHNYQYDNPELGMTRSDKLLRDIDRYFMTGITGIDRDLKKSMKEFLCTRLITLSQDLHHVSPGTAGHPLGR